MGEVSTKEPKKEKESKKDKRERKKEKKELKAKTEKTTEPTEPSPESGVDEDKDEALESATNGQEELEIDLNASVPLSRKKQRLLKKGKLDLDKIAKKNPPPKPITEEGAEPEKTPKKSPFGVWIGNLSFDTTKEDIVWYIIAKTQAHEPETELVSVEEADISRVNLPKKADKIKGFCYVDLPSENHVKSVVALSEGLLNGRRLLIKSSTSFEGRPEAHAASKSLLKNPPLRILFVGNLSFDVTEDLLEEHFRHCGEIARIRMGTFQDTGKCKGWAFVDFKEEEGATTALKSKLAKTMINRPLRLEYGEDRSKRNPMRRNMAVEQTDSAAESAPSETVKEAPVYKERQAPRVAKRPAPQSSDFKQKRLKSSVALATAQRASAAIVPSQGKKVKFD